MRHRGGYISNVNKRTCLSEEVPVRRVDGEKVMALKKSDSSQSMEAGVV